MTKPRLDQGPDYERGFIDGMQHQMQSSVDKAVNRMAQPQRTWVGLTEVEVNEVLGGDIRDEPSGLLEFVRAIEAKLKEKNA